MNSVKINGLGGGEGGGAKAERLAEKAEKQNYVIE